MTEMALEENVRRANTEEEEMEVEELFFSKSKGENSSSSVEGRNEDEKEVKLKEKEEGGEEEEFLGEEYLFNFFGLQHNRKLAIGRGFIARAANGFVKLFTEQAIRYWCAQTTCENRAPDWKLHFSIHPEDLSMAWNILSNLFVDSGKGAMGMKAIFSEEWNSSLRGREVTVYLFQYYRPEKITHVPCYGNPGASSNTFKRQKSRRTSLRTSSSVYNRTTRQVMSFSTSNPFDMYDLTSETEQELDVLSWSKKFMVKAELLLRKNGIRSNGRAKGDKQIPGCHYMTLRNEAFVFCQSVGAFIYPPDNAGWNAACHCDTFRLPLIKFANKYLIGEGGTEAGQKKKKEQKENRGEKRTQRHLFAAIVSCGIAGPQGGSSESDSLSWSVPLEE